MDGGKGYVEIVDNVQAKDNDWKLSIGRRKGPLGEWTEELVREGGCRYATPSPSSTLIVVLRSMALITALRV